MKTMHSPKRTHRIARHMSLLPTSSFGSEFGHMLSGFGLFRALQEPALDVTRKNDKVIVRMEVPGMEEKDIRVRQHRDLLTISGEKSSRREIKKRNSYYCETRSGEFERTVRLPEGTQHETKKTHFKNGVLTIEFRKRK